MQQAKLTCVGCPLGCQVNLKIGPAGDIDEVNGNQCKQGRRLTITEFRNPTRVLTTTVFVEGGDRRVLPVRTDRLVPKAALRELMRAAGQIKVRPPVEVGQEISHNILGSGANLVATGRLRSTL